MPPFLHIMRQNALLLFIHITLFLLSPAMHVHVKGRERRRRPVALDEGCL